MPTRRFKSFIIIVMNARISSTAQLVSLTSTDFSSYHKQSPLN